MCPTQNMNFILRHIRILLLLALIGAPAMTAVAQRQKIKNLPYYDQRLLHWGFSFGFSMPTISFAHTGSEAAEGWWTTCPKVNPSFQVGLMGDLAITEHLNFRVSPFLYFQERTVRFERVTLEGRERTNQQLKTTYIEIPATLKISTRRINNYRPYLVAGAQFDFDIGKEKETPIVFNRIDLGVHIGMGCDFYLPFFKLAPEFRFNLGLLDMIDHKREDLKDLTLMPYTEAVKSARNTGISFILWFE